MEPLMKPANLMGAYHIAWKLLAIKRTDERLDLKGTD
jgi:hypothetical protein